MDGKFEGFSNVVTRDISMADSRCRGHFVLYGNAQRAKRLGVDVGHPVTA